MRRPDARDDSTETTSRVLLTGFHFTLDGGFWIHQKTVSGVDDGRPIEDLLYPYPALSTEVRAQMAFLGLI